MDYLELKIKLDLSYPEQLVIIVDQRKKTMKNKIIPLVLVS